MSALARGKGHLPNRPHVLGAPIGALIQRLSSGSLRPVAFTNAPLWGNVNDQGISSGCTSQGTTKMAFVRGRRMAQAGLQTALPELAPRYTYAVTRARTMLKGDAFVDQGAMPGDALISAATDGFIAESRLPFSSETVNDFIPDDAFAAGVDAKLSAYHSIFEEGDERLAAIDETIFTVGAVGFAMPVDASYEQLEDQSVWRGLSGPILGYHWQVLIGYTADYYEVGGSWGIGFGYGGFARVARAFVRSQYVTDLAAIDVAPGGVT